ncbi:long-chain-fatty-acid--CoA ligase [Natronorubrum bangense]|uniref:AMP-dependent synthetase and ligase n=2 Tax=Natronorubrum bangense TaxID=61858 RepID=L9WRH8_9EURY|nr:long-chain-fatty-acid--CoA ligase [Natronorubrum bangense]ELY51997.1 AMP-dependent synthetase and ligase [Natronorubrum bangense JCM 10635]QCC54791.1 long-chain fatty acid--CoA ligase [Natronorubrum bangense]
MEVPLLVTDFLDRARKYYGDEEAIVATTGERFTYDEFGDRADRLSAVLQERGIEKGDRVAVLDPNTHYHLESAYGIMQLGAIHAPLNYRLTPEDYEYMLNDAGVTAVVADYEYAEKIEAIRDEVPTETFITNDADAVEGDWEDFDALIEDAEPDYERPEMSEDDVITINYTSGTTGDPKGVMRTHRTESLHAQLVTIHHEITDDDVYLWTLPMFHVNGWGHIYAITGMGAKHVCTRGVDAGQIFTDIATEDVSFLCCAPTVLSLLEEYREENDVELTGDNPMRVTAAGAAPPESIIETVEEEFGWHFRQLYGATETGPLIGTSATRRLIDEDSERRFALKKRQGIAPLATQVEVVDDEGNEVPWDDETIGEILVRGNQVMEGYWEKPEETDEAFNDKREGWFHTGDLAVVNDDGMIAIQDREKDIIISGGENISSIELEDTLFDHDAVSDVAVIPSPSEKWGETPKAFVVPSNDDPENPPISPDELTAFTREKLAGYKVVHRVEFVDELPKTATGKIQKYELREEEWDEEEGMVGQG